MMKKTSFGINANEPSGTTFVDMPKAKFAGATNTKRKADFSIVTEAKGPTLTENHSFISIPKADKGKPMGEKTMAESTGTYSPAKKGPQDFGGSEGVKGTMKSGKTDKKSHRFT